MSDPRQVIKEQGSDLQFEESKIVTCPFCQRDWKNQGKPLHWKPSRSCSISRNTLGLLFNCFRAGCSSGRGFIGTSFIDSKSSHVKKFEPRRYEYETRFPNQEELEYLNRRFEFTEQVVQENGIRYCPDRGTYVFPIRDFRGYDCGLVDRDFHNKRDLKAITYWFNDVPKLYFTPVHGDACIVVEDIPSAIKASRFLPAVALMGTHLNDEQVNLLSKLYSKVYIALDEDATAKAVHLVKKYRLYFQQMEILPLKKDIKDTSYKELRETLWIKMM